MSLLWTCVCVLVQNNITKENVVNYVQAAIQGSRWKSPVGTLTDASPSLPLYWLEFENFTFTPG